MPATAFFHTDSHPIPDHGVVVCGQAGALGERMPHFGAPGTGGVSSIEYMRARAGYSYVVVPSRVSASIAASSGVSGSSSHVSDLMQEVRSGFGRTFSHLPEAFGVSRQTLYNWQKGDTPRPEHLDRLRQLAHAARVFVREGFKPASSTLGRVVMQGKSFLELIRQGEDGEELAKRLMRIEQRGMAARKRLDGLLAGRERTRPDVGEMGRQAFDERA